MSRVRRLASRGRSILRRLRPYRGPRLVFVHMPKCGGTSVLEAVGERIPAHRRVQVDFGAMVRAGLRTVDARLLGTGFRDDLTCARYLLCYHLERGATYVAGHLPVSEAVVAHYDPEVRFVTLLRDPVERWKSAYLFIKRLPDPLGINQPSIDFQGAPADEFARVMESGMGLLMGSVMTSLLAGAYPRDRDHALELAESARRVLDGFSVVGRLDDLDAFEAELARLMGTGLRIARTNVTRGLYRENADAWGELRRFLDRDDVTAAVADLCAPDRRVYDRVATPE